MSDILIKGAKMPKSCEECDFLEYDDEYEYECWCPIMHINVEEYTLYLGACRYMDVSTGYLGVMGMKPKWMQIFDDILPALIGVILIIGFVFPTKDRLFLMFCGIELVANTLTRILERLGGSDD